MLFCSIGYGKYKYIECDGREGVVTAGDIHTDSDIEIMNPDLPIATLNGGNVFILKLKKYTKIRDFFRKTLIFYRKTIRLSIAVSNVSTN